MFLFHDRMIKIFDEQYTQCVNICTPANTEGEYEQKFYFTGDFRVTQAEVEARSDLTALVEWLRDRLYQQVYSWAKKT